VTDGGYDDGYRECPCFWGNEPGSYVKLLCEYVPSFEGLRILDAGCGEGKNAIFLAQKGGSVDAIEMSELALRNGMHHWNGNTSVRWSNADVRNIDLPREQYDIVVAYGLLHCLHSINEIHAVLTTLQETTCIHGFNVICVFNSRHQELHAHPGFSPTLLSHGEYLRLYSRGWKILAESDSDLIERHPHNDIEHTHSMTRMLAQKVLS
jgi:SAM-dependent methyltransferase